MHLPALPALKMAWIFDCESALPKNSTSSTAAVALCARALPRSLINGAEVVAGRVQLRTVYPTSYPSK